MACLHISCYSPPLSLFLSLSSSLVHSLFSFYVLFTWCLYSALHLFQTCEWLEAQGFGPSTVNVVLANDLDGYDLWNCEAEDLADVLGDTATLEQVKRIESLIHEFEPKPFDPKFTAEEVGEWLEEMGFTACAAEAVAHELDGEDLINMEEEEWAALGIDSDALFDAIKGEVTGFEQTN